MAEEKAGFHNKRILDKASLNPNGKLENKPPLAQPPKQPSCPRCGSTRLYKDGLRYLKDGTTVQRWLCRECFYRFSQRKPLQKNQKWQINRASTLLSKRQVCELLTRVSKNLTEVETRQETAQREGTTQKAAIKGKIVEFMWKLKKQGYSEQTIRTYITLLKTLTSKGANILDPEEVKKIIATKIKNPTTKWNYCNFYDAFTKHMGLTWEKPVYKPQNKIPFIPTEQELDQLINGTGWKLSVILQIAKETAMRIGEILKLKWENIDPQKRLIIINDPEKGSKPGICRISQNLIERILNLPRKSELIFYPAKPSSMASTFAEAKKRLAKKLNNPRLLRITFHTFRHWKATVEYHKTKDILHVQELLRHKNIRNTLIYITIEKGLYREQSADEFHVKVAKNVEEAVKLIEVGFEYVTGDYNDGGKIFRKRK